MYYFCLLKTSIMIWYFHVEIAGQIHLEISARTNVTSKYLRKKQHFLCADLVKCINLVEWNHKHKEFSAKLLIWKVEDMQTCRAPKTGSFILKVLKMISYSPTEPYHSWWVITSYQCGFKFNWIQGHSPNADTPDIIYIEFSWTITNSW